MSTPTYAGTINRYRVQYDTRMGSEQFSPFVVPADIFNYLLLITSLMFKQRTSSVSKVPVYLAIVILSCSSLQTSRSLGVAYGVLVGISSSLCVVLSLNLMFLHQSGKHFKRIIACHSNSMHDDQSRRTCNTLEQWQSMPKSAHSRLTWILDLLGSLRALHWSHGQSPSQVSGHCKEGTGDKTSFQKDFYSLSLVYLCVDCIKEIIAMDPYFWGYIDHDPPSYVQSILPFTILVQAYRMVVAFATLYLALQFGHTLCILLFVHMLGPSIAGPWGKEYAYRPLFGDTNSVCVRGLQGWWGTWWHQLFRFTLTSPTNTIINKLHVSKGSMIERTIRLVVPFLLSGFIHASGSYTMWGETRPLNSFMFFVLQPVGIFLQIMGSRSLVRLNLMSKIPPLVREVTNVAITVIWLLSTFPLLADDFARGGLFLTEPFPFSVLQMLGLGSEARSYQLWSGYGISLHMGRRWWQTGLAL